MNITAYQVWGMRYDHWAVLKSKSLEFQNILKFDFVYKTNELLWRKNDKTVSIQSIYQNKKQLKYALLNQNLKINDNK